MYCKKCAAKLGEDALCPVCGTNQKEEEVKPVKLLKTDTRVIFAVLAVLLVIAFFLPNYKITADIMEVTYHGHEEEIGGVKETVAGNVSGLWASNSMREYIFAVFLLVPFLVLLAIAESRDKVNIGYFYKIMTALFAAGIVLLIGVYIWYTLNLITLHPYPVYPDGVRMKVYNYDAGIIAARLSGAAEADFSRVTSVFPLIGWFLSAAFYALGIRLSRLCAQRYKRG